MKRWKGAALLLLCTVVMLRLLQGLAQPEKENAHVPVLGIVTTAAEDDRREAQSEALVHAAEEHGFKVLEMPVERTQEAQIEAVRALIVYQVDAIAFTPLVESGWDNVLREAKSASVPLLSIDRAIRGVDDVPLQHIGFDYASLAEQAADALLQQRMPRDGVLELYGTVNASDAREIARGCRASLEEHGLTVTYSLCGDGMRSRGCEILEEMEDYLKLVRQPCFPNTGTTVGIWIYWSTKSATFSPRMTRWRSVRWIICTATAANRARMCWFVRLAAVRSCARCRKKGRLP